MNREKYLEEQVEILAEEKRELVEALGNMTGWAAYLDDCDPFYASEEHRGSNEFDTELAQARILLARVNAKEEEDERHT